MVRRLVGALVVGVLVVVLGLVSPELRVADGATTVVDPGASGRYQVEVADYSLGDRAVYLPALGAKSELTGRVYAPKDAPGRRPLVLFLHGIHTVCYGGDDPDALMQWPCPKGAAPIPSYRGYDAPARALASHGYQVVSISANAINLLDFDTMMTGSLARAQLVFAHLELWKRWSSSPDGPFGRRYLGTVDFGRIGLMGHSRGAEGMVRAAQLNAERGRPYGIRAVLPLAAGNFLRGTLPGIALSVILPYCDGDVPDMFGQRYYDDTRYASTGDPAARSVVLVMGANHNYFNTEWTPGRSESPDSVDDWNSNAKAEPCGAGTRQRLTAVEQEAVGRAYIAGFFRLELGGERALLPLLDGSNTRAKSAGRAVVHVVAQAPARYRYDLARFDRAVPVSGAASVRRCDARCVSGGYGRTPHWSTIPPSEAAPTTTVTQLSWTGRSGGIRIDLPVGKRDVRRFAALSLRAAPATGARSDLTIRLTDGRGRTEAVAVSSVSDALNPLPGKVPDLLPKVMLRTVRIPLAGLRSADLRDIRTVELLTDRTAKGSVFLSDLAFSTPALSRPPLVPVPVLSVNDVTTDEGDTGPRSVDFQVRLSRPSRLPITFWAEVVTDSDEVVGPFKRKLVLPAGRRSVTVSVPVRPNRRDGQDQRFDLVLSVPTEATVGDGLGTGLVRDDDPPPVVTIGAGTATEGQGGLRFPIRLSAASDRGPDLVAQLRDGTARFGRDFTNPDGDNRTVYFSVPAGQTSAELVVPVKDDRLRESTERFTLRITQVSNGVLKVPTDRTGTIHDND